MAGNSTDPGRSVTSTVTAILMAFADRGVHTLTDVAGSADLSTAAHRLASALVIHAESLLHSMIPAHAPASGKALRTFSPATVVDYVIKAGLPAFTPHTITSPDTLRHRLTTTRLTQVAHNEFKSGTAAIGTVRPNRLSPHSLPTSDLQAPGIDFEPPHIDVLPRPEPSTDASTPRSPKLADHSAGQFPGYIRLGLPTSLSY